MFSCGFWLAFCIFYIFSPMIIHGKYCCNKEPQKAGMKHFENLKKFLKEIQYLFIHLFISYIFMYLFSLSLLNSYWYSQNWVLGMENKVKSSRSQMFFRIGVFKIFADFTGKRLWWILFLVNYTLLKRDSNTSFSCEICKNTYFYRTSTVAASTGHLRVFPLWLICARLQ